MDLPFNGVGITKNRRNSSSYPPSPTNSELPSGCIALASSCCGKKNEKNSAQVQLAFLYLFKRIPLLWILLHDCQCWCTADKVFLLQSYLSPGHLSLDTHVLLIFHFNPKVIFSKPNFEHKPTFSTHE